jgi:hypothetical protein
VSATRVAAELDSEVGGTLLLVLVVAAESFESVPPHAASMQNKTPKAPPRITIFIVYFPV